MQFAQGVDSDRFSNEKVKHFTSLGRTEMTLHRNFIASVIILVLLGIGYAIAGQTKPVAPIPANAIVWEQVDIASRDTFRGPTSEGIAPALEKVKFMGRQHGGNNLKYRVEDANGREWVVKIADESQAEVAANRLLWAIGYRTEIDQIVPRINIDGIGNYKNARFEARAKEIERGDRWSWSNNPLAGTKEFDGLRLMMAFVNNWDLKDDNNAIVTENGKAYLLVSDMGSSFGKLANSNTSRSGRSVNKAEHFAEANFIKAVNNGVLELDYRGGGADHLKGITVENARWLVGLLTQLSDKQISDAFRAANHSNEDVNLYTQAVKDRIAALSKAVEANVASN